MTHTLMRKSGIKLEGEQLGFISDSEGPLETTVSNTLTVAAEVNDRWAEKCKKEGTSKWFSPFDTLANRQYFPTRAKCLAYMKKNQSASIELAKLEKKPEPEYTPHQQKISPKRTLTDLLPIAQAKLMERMQKAVAATAGLRAQSMAAVGNDVKAVNVVGLPEQMAILKLHKLSDAELKLATHLCWTRGRKKVAAAGKALCATRGIPLDF